MEYAEHINVYLPMLKRRIFLLLDIFSPGLLYNTVNSCLLILLRFFPNKNDQGKSILKKTKKKLR